jgi:maltooligosyltrehalose trehalohydrolase
MPFGAELRPEGTRFRLWAPAASRVAVAVEGAGTQAAERPLERAEDGWFAGFLPGVRAGARYRYRVDGGAAVPDPASRFQPEGVGGPSEVIDAAAFAWDDAGWRGRPFEEAVLYELHVGAFTPEGDFAGVARRLDALAELGVTALELMPVAAFAGSRNWGHDGVLPFAPAAAYGRPEALKRLVAEAHGRGLMVLLDVVYNHFGPEGNHLRRYAPAFFTDRHRSEGALPVGAAAFGDLEIPLPAEDAARRWRDALSGRAVAARAGEGGPALAGAELFAALPVAVLADAPEGA